MRRKSHISLTGLIYDIFESNVFNSGHFIEFLHNALCSYAALFPAAERHFE